MRFDGVARMSAAPWVSFADIDVVECNGSSWFDCGRGLGSFPSPQPVPVGSPWLSGGIAAGWFLRLSGGFSLVLRREAAQFRYRFLRLSGGFSFVSDRVAGPRSF